MRRRLSIVAAAIALGASGCGFQVLDRWDGDTVRAAQVKAPADSVWAVVVERIDRLELPISRLEPEAHIVALSWVTAPGDGGQYLECAGDTPVGSASLMPRVLITELADGGSRVEVSSVVRATSGQACRSNGRYEAWLLSSLELDSGDVATSPATPAEARAGSR